MYGAMPFMMPNAIPGATAAASAANSLGSASTATSFLGKINWSSLLSNTQKVLNVANQVIPLYYQAKPMFQNLKALGRIGKEFSKMGNQNNTQNNTQNNIVNNTMNSAPSTQNDTSFEEDLPTPKFFL